ncbi:MAG: 30S ribosome-binding factor RbfA [Candidatus Eisenbacteria sp.]|nr:30S ribosome-binding factor RbfA [Candidatus Eisenbacteria bacterium]
MASPVRRERVAGQIRNELSDIVQHGIRDPRLGWVTVTRVEMSPDLCYAKIFVSIYGDEDAQRASLQVLEHAHGYMRSELGRRLRTRQTPELHFRMDESLDHSQRIQEILDATEIPPAVDEEEEES